MSISELLPAVHSLSAPDKIQLIRILAEDLAGVNGSPLNGFAGDAAVWSPHNAFEAADTLLSALRTEAQQSAHA